MIAHLGPLHDLVFFGFGRVSQVVEGFLREQSGKIAWGELVRRSFHACQKSKINHIRLRAVGFRAWFWD